MWLLPVIRPLPGASTGGAGDWFTLVVVVGLLAVITTVLIVAANQGQSGSAGRPARPEHRDRAA